MRKENLIQMVLSIIIILAILCNIALACSERNIEAFVGWISALLGWGLVFLHEMWMYVDCKERDKE